MEGESFAFISVALSLSLESRVNNKGETERQDALSQEAQCFSMHLLPMIQVN